MSSVWVAAVQPPSYPARPLNGGPLELAPPKPGQWSVRTQVQWLAGAGACAHGVDVQPVWSALEHCRRVWQRLEAPACRGTHGRGTSGRMVRL